LPEFKVAFIAILIFIGSLGLTVVSAVLPDPPLVIPEGPLVCKSSSGNDACKESGETRVSGGGATMHLARWTGKVHGRFAKALLVSD